MERIAADILEFSRIEKRLAGSEGEREMLHAVRKRLPDGCIGRIEPFVAHTSPSLVAAAHDLALVFAGLLGLWQPWVGVLVAAFVTASLALEGAGRTSPLRAMLPMSASYNFVVRQKAPGAHGTIVFAAPLDAPPWEPADIPWVRNARPMRLTFGAGALITGILALRTLAEPWGPRSFELYVGSLAVLGVGMLLGVVAHRRPGDGKDDGSGPAAVLELMRRLQREAVPGVDVWFAFTGCARAYQGGMDAFLTLHRRTFQGPVLVVAVADVACAPLSAITAEGPLFTQSHRPTGPALVERLRWAGVQVPSIDYAGATDARAAFVLKYRALAFKGGEDKPSSEAAARAVDVLETISRWFADDLARVAVNRPTLKELARTTLPPETTDEEEPDLGEPHTNEALR